MQVRTMSSTVRFSSAFRLYGFDEPQPAGEYRIEYDEEDIGGTSFSAYRRVATFMYLPSIATGGGTSQMVPIDPVELEAELRKDRETT